MTYEVVMVDGIEDDFANSTFDEARIVSLLEKVKEIAQSNNPRLLTERVLNTPLRKIASGDYRMFFFIDQQTEVIYCLSFLHRKKCYKEKQLKRVLSILQREIKEDP